MLFPLFFSNLVAHPVGFGTDLVIQAHRASHLGNLRPLQKRFPETSSEFYNGRITKSVPDPMDCPNLHVDTTIYRM